MSIFPATPAISKGTPITEASQLSLLRNNQTLERPFKEMVHSSFKHDQQNKFSRPLITWKHNMECSDASIMFIYFHFWLSIRTYIVTVISVVWFSITCLVSKILKKKDTILVRHLGYFNETPWRHKPGFFCKKQLAKLFDVKIHVDLYVYASYVRC